MKTVLATYFNERTLGGVGIAPTAIVALATSGILLATVSAPGLMAGSFTLLLAAGCVNKWQERATGKYLWKPRVVLGI